MRRLGCDAVIVIGLSRVVKRIFATRLDLIHDRLRGMARRKKTGPKPKPVAEKRRRPVMLTLTDGEYQGVAHAAREQHKPVAVYLREKALAS